MSILNKGDGELEILILLAEYLVKKQSQPLAEIYSVFTPDGVSKERLNQTISRWKQLGLFKKNSEILSLSSEFDSIQPKEFENFFPKNLCAIIFKDTNNPADKFFAEGTLASDLTRGIAWMMHQDPVHFSPSLSGGFDPAQEKFLIPQCGLENTIVTNDTRWTSLRRWAGTLGFLTGDASSIFLDPTLAIKRVIPDIFDECQLNLKEVKGEQLLPLTVFVNCLATKLPVLDQGKYFERVSQVINSRALAVPGKKNLTKAMSLALKNLDKKIITLKEVADATSTMSIDYDHETQINYDYIQLNQ